MKYFVKSWKEHFSYLKKKFNNKYVFSQNCEIMTELGSKDANKWLFILI